MILKKCKNVYCGQFFPGAIGDFTFFCPKCATKAVPPLNRTFMDKVYDNIKNTRSVTVEYFDIYDSEYPYLDHYERVCRNCGSRLLKKDGTYNPQRRFCKKCGGLSFYNQYLWEFTRSKILHENQQKYKDLIDDYRIKREKSIFYNIYVCEQCHKFTNYDKVEVHHIKPVHTLTFEEIKLIWDSVNLIVLCTTCHDQQDHQLSRKYNLPKDVDRLQRLLEEWI